MTAVVSFDRPALEPVDPDRPVPPPDPERPPAPRRPKPARVRGRGSLRWAWAPALISVSVNVFFLVAWWAPEFGEFAGRDALLNQLWPLASKELTTGGAAVAPIQALHSGVLAALLLGTSIALPFLARSHNRPVRVLLPAAALYVGVLTWLVTVVQLVTGRGGDAWFGLLLLTAWVAAAAVTVWRSRYVADADLPARRPPLGWLVVVVVLLYPVPLAIGRALFAQDSGHAARALLAADPTQQLSVLISTATLLAYVSGVLVVIVVWAGYMLVPPYTRIGVPWVRSRPVTVDPLVARLAVTLLTGALLLLCAFPAADAGREQAKRMLAGDPGADQLACGTWVQQRPGRPTATLVSRGDRCRGLVAYAGYTESGTANLVSPLQPVKATMPDKRAITTKVVAGQYGAVVVLAATSAVDWAPDELFGVSMDTARPIWAFRCNDDGAMRLRFAGTDPVPGAKPAAEVAAGHVTNPGEKPAVVVLCTNQAVRLDPATGRPAS